MRRPACALAAEGRVPDGQTRRSLIPLINSSRPAGRRRRVWHAAIWEHVFPFQLDLHASGAWGVSVYRAGPTVASLTPPTPLAPPPAVPREGGEGEPSIFECIVRNDKFEVKVTQVSAAVPLAVVPLVGGQSDPGQSCSTIGGRPGTGSNLLMTSAC